MKISTSAYGLLMIYVALPAFAGSAKTVVGKWETRFEIPSESPVSFVSADEEGAHFKGRFTLTGKYRYGYSVDPAAMKPSEEDIADKFYSSDNLLELSFVPDKDQRVRLPFWKDGNRVHEITFRNQREFINAVISPAAMEAIKERSALSVYGRASIVVDDYVVSVECNYATYAATFISVRDDITTSLAKSAVEEHGC